MKKVIGKNQVIITSLAILIAVAGYLNFADVDLGFRDKEASTDSSSILEDAGYDLTDETALLDENQADGGLTDNNLTDSQETDTPGEAVFTGSTGFAAQAKISREQVRSQNKADLQDIINNEEIDDEEKQEAIHTMVSMTDLSEKEAAAELLLEAKGFKNVVVNLTGETADVVIPEAELSDAQRAQIEDIVKRKTGIAPENIVITPLLPPIKGLHDRIDKEGSKIASILGMINHINDYPEDMTGKKVVVVGGGAVGLDVVEFFAARNAEISIVEMMDQIGRDLDPVTKNDMKDQMKKHHVAQLTKTALQEVKDSSFLVKDVEGERELPFDYGFVCLGMRAQGQPFTELSDAFVSDDVEILNIGDSKRARRIIDGTLEGRNILNTLTQMGYL